MKKIKSKYIFFFFHFSCHTSGAWKPYIFSSLANSRAFSLSRGSFTGTFSLRKIGSHFFIWKSFYLFFFFLEVERVFSATPKSEATTLWEVFISRALNLIFKDLSKCRCFRAELVAMSDVDFVRIKINKFNAVKKFQHSTFHLAKTLPTRFFFHGSFSYIMLSVRIKEKYICLGTEESVPNMKVFEIWRFELWEVTYKSLLRSFHRAREIVRLREMFESWEVKL